jgi:DNA-directed RNA polymerase specialized sigma24 family protein
MAINREDEWTIEGLEVTAPLDSDRYLSLEPLVNDVASKEWKGSHIYEMEDVAQAIWLHMMEHWKEYDQAEEGLIRHMAKRAARAYCERQRIDYMYSTGAFLYTPGLVRRYMEEVVFCAPENAVDVEARADLTEAYELLPKGQRAAIFKKYALKEPLVTSAEKAVEYRAINAITHRLNTGLRLRAEEF